jgi:hypothetical protein
MNLEDITMPIKDGLFIKQPEYDCPKHGTVVSTVIFSNVIDGTTQRFCMKCCFEKMIEIGVCEVTEKKP